MAPRGHEDERDDRAALVWVRNFKRQRWDLVESAIDLPPLLLLRSYYQERVNCIGKQGKEVALFKYRWWYH